MHMDSGLGNQMLDFAEYLAIKKANPDEEVFLETVLYEISDDRPGMYSKWNGYELERIFNIHPQMLKDKLGKDAWHRIVTITDQSMFWEKGWDYAPVIIKALESEGIYLKNMQKDSRDIIIAEHEMKQKPWRKMITSFFHTKLGYHIKRITKKLLQKQIVEAENVKYDVYQKYQDNIYTGHSLSFEYKGFGIEKIDKELRNYFKFPDITDRRNLKILQEIHNCNAVAIHARRGDMLSRNNYCYQYGFFRRSVKHIKKNIEKPVFFFFCDEYSRGWCEQNAKIFGLNFQKDEIRFVTWNDGEKSYIDMQLMAQCKHNIFTESSFGFWGAYLNLNPQKITCAPDPTILATNWF